MLLVVGVAGAPLLAFALHRLSINFRPPSEVDLLSYSATIWSAAESFLTLEFPPGGWRSVRRADLRPIGGALGSSRCLGITPAFLGQLHQGGQKLWVQASFETSTRGIRLMFRQPINPGSSLTVVLVPHPSPLTTPPRPITLHWQECLIRLA